MVDQEGMSWWDPVRPPRRGPSRSPTGSCRTTGSRGRLPPQEGGDRVFRRTQYFRSGETGMTCLPGSHHPVVGPRDQVREYVSSENSGSARKTLPSSTKFGVTFQMRSISIPFCSASLPLKIPRPQKMPGVHVELEVRPLHEERRDVELQAVVEPGALQARFVVLELVRFVLQARSARCGRAGALLPPRRNPSL